MNVFKHTCVLTSDKIPSCSFFFPKEKIEKGVILRRERTDETFLQQYTLLYTISFSLAKSRLLVSYLLAG